jgi:hypothetical protein
MLRYRSVGVGLALALFAGCGQSTPPHPRGWPQVSHDVWSTVSGAGPERYQYAAKPTTGSLSDLASSEAIATVQQFQGSRLISSAPFPACPGEAGLARFALRGPDVLEVAFTVYRGSAITVSYRRPKSVADAPAALTAMRQAVCWTL